MTAVGRRCRYNTVSGLGTAYCPGYSDINGPLDQLNNSLTNLLTTVRCHCFCCCRYLIDISDYIPGDTDWCAPDSPAQDSTCEHHLPRKTRDMLDAKIMGENFTAWRMASQDGRFIAGFAAEKLRAVGGGRWAVGGGRWAWGRLVCAQ